MPHVIDFGIGVRPNSEVFIKLRADIIMAAEDIKRISLVRKTSI